MAAPINKFYAPDLSATASFLISINKKNYRVISISYFFGVFNVMYPSKTPIAELFPLLQNGDTEAFNALFRGHYTRLTAFARQYVQRQELAEEVVSDVFVKLWLNRARLGNVTKPEIYFYVAVKNNALNYLRSIKNETTSIDHDGLQPEPCLEPDGGSHELKQVLGLAIAALPEQRRIVFCLIKEDGLKTAEVAVILGVSPRTVESQLYKAVKFIADRLSTYLGYHPQHPARRKSF